jgi:putative N6-adenine-specific DNA methylase
MLNPPYGERIAPKGRAAAARASAREDGLRGRRRRRRLLRRAGGALEAPLRPAGRPGAEPRDEAAVADAAEGSRRVPMWNGAIECRLFRFDLVAGSNA